MCSQYALRRRAPLPNSGGNDTNACSKMVFIVAASAVFNDGFAESGWVSISTCCFLRVAVSRCRVAPQGQMLRKSYKQNTFFKVIPLSLPYWHTTPMLAATDRGITSGTRLNSCSRGRALRNKSSTTKFSPLSQQLPSAWCARTGHFRHERR
jgi:hypothetical protein